MKNQFQLQFDGLFAENHILPMGQLGRSLIGADRIITTGLIFFAYGRPPKRGERFELVVTAKEPEEGSMIIAMIINQAPWVLPLVQEFLINGGTDLAYRFLSYVMTFFGGRKKEAQMHLDALLQMNRDHLESRDQNDERWRMLFTQTVDRLAPAAKQTVDAIGVGAEKLFISGPKPNSLTTIDEPMADAIRSKEDDEVGDMQEMEIRVDGFIHHSKQLKIIHPDIEGRFITAEVRDPLFESLPNPYTDAAISSAAIKVMAKPIYRNGVVHKIYVMDLAKS